MIHYYTNRELSHLLGINLARWKRWSRSFLPPDPLGGMQSGYARQYTFKDLFTVFLGGYLVGHLKLSVLESQTVLSDLSGWLKKNGFMKLNVDGVQEFPQGEGGSRYLIFFCPISQSNGRQATGYRYLIRKTVDTRIATPASGHRTMEAIEETVLCAGPSDATAIYNDPFVRLINLSAIHNHLVKKLITVQDVQE